MTLRRLWQYARAGWFTVTAFYIALLALSYALYYYANKLPGIHAADLTGAVSFWHSTDAFISGLQHIWWIFVWGFGLQFLVQLNWIFKRHPKEGGVAFLFKRGAWLSLHAGLFEELIFRYFAYLSFVLGLVYLNNQTGGWLAGLAQQYVLPILNFVTLGFFHDQFTAAHWALGVGAVIGASFFRSAHVHYGKLSKANVYVIGVVMFWLTFNYGLVTAIAAHFAYDLCVFTAIAVASPFQPHSKQE